MTRDIRLAGLSTQKGDKVYNLSLDHPIMLVFLRHFGCIFCRESLRDLSRLRDAIEGDGVQMVFVHMATPEIAEMYFRSFNLDGVDHISDPGCSYYAAFGLGKGNISQLFGLKNLVRGFEVTIGKGIPVTTKQIGDNTQMPGIFIVHKGQITNSFIHTYAGDKPDYKKLIEEGTITQDVAVN